MKIQTVHNGRPCEVAARSPIVHQRSIVAIDPDNKASGVAWIERGRIVRLESMSLFDLQDEIPAIAAAGYLVVMEFIDNSKPTFRGSENNQKVRDAISRSIGRAQDAARQLRLLFERSGVEYVLVEPLRGFEKRTAKADAGFFKDLTGWTGRTNEDKRDAGMLGLYGLPHGYRVCEQRHVHMTAVCPSCHREEMRRARRRARSAAKKLAKEA